MFFERPVKLGLLVFAILALTTLGLTACGKKDEDKTKALDLSISESGKKASYQLPNQIDGGLTKITFTNNGKKPHDAQLVLVNGSHSSQEVLKVLGSDEPKIPDWLRAEGGGSRTLPGATSTATLNLPAGHYFLFDGESQGKNGAHAELDVGSGKAGDLPETDATVVADEVGKDKYKWQISGLKAGENTFQFQSKGKEALHHVVFSPIKGNATIIDVTKALSSNSGPPPLDFEKNQNTAVLDGGRDEVTTVNLKPGRYALLCFLPDRDGGKEHFKEGLAAAVTIK